jgi:serine/threonine-protein kinase
MSLQKLGRYDLIRVLGKGAMGLVYEGRDPNLDRRVAIKTIKVENLSEEEAAEYEVRFRTEARSAARLQHPNIVSVYDSDRDIDIAYLVMEFIQGEDLKHHLDKGVRYSLEQAAGIMNDLLSALDYAHRQNIVHRDVKPANLLIEPSGRVKLTDFGVARIQDSGEATRTQGTMVGTLKYMSPEQVQGLPVDSRSDLFAAGIVLYQLLTGKRPFDGVGDYDIIQQIISKPVVPPSSFSPNLPRQIDDVIARALEKSRDRRYPTAQEFNAALQAAAKFASDPTIAPPANRAQPGPNATWTNTLVAGEALVNTNTGGSAAVSGSTVTQEVELVYWKEVKDSVDIDDFHDFLSKFPTGIYADLARRRLKRLAVVAEDGSSGSQSSTRTRLIIADKLVPATVVDPEPAAPAIAAKPQPVVADARPAVPQPQAVVAAVVASDGSSKAVAALKRPAWMWAVAGLVIVGVAGLGVKLMTGTAATDPAEPTFGSSEPAMAPQSGASLPLVVASAPTAASSAPAAVASMQPVTPSMPSAVAKIAGVPLSAASNARKPSQSSAAPAVNAPVKPTASTAPSTLQVEPPRSTQKAAAAVTPAVAVEQALGGDPRKECEGRWLLSFQICLSEQCSKSQYANHAVCIERKAMEKRNTEFEQSGGR